MCATSFTTGEAETGSSTSALAREPLFPDADAFCRRVSESAFFAGDTPIAIGRAPGRLDVLGGIADYSGSLVLELPLRAAALAAVQSSADGRVVAVSGDRRIVVDVADLVGASLDGLARGFTGRDAWAAYVLGPVALLAREERVAPAGLRLLLSSEIPEGKGVGSSAAVEIAVLQATAACLRVTVEPRRLALFGQRAEQIFAGAPCGAMDQLAVMHGEAGRLLALLCRPAEIVASIPLPPPLVLWGIDSGLRHAVSGSTYRRVRCAAFMGKALLARDEEYLAELDRAEVDPNMLPELLLGADFLRLRDGIDDPVSAVEPAVVYPVRAATIFPLEEQVRVRRFMELLEQPTCNDNVRLLGDLMSKSHAGYSRCGLGVPRTDELVEAVRRVGWENGLIGARVSGGGSGGTVVVLGRENAEPRVRAIAEELGAGLVAGSSAGAERFGVRFMPGGSGRR
ncbi:MAG: GHMP family kinase ATP-binding protein [Gaiellaceae bacterium]